MGRRHKAGDDDCILIETHPSHSSRNRRTHPAFLSQKNGRKPMKAIITATALAFALSGTALAQSAMPGQEPTPSTMPTQTQVPSTMPNANQTPEAPANGTMPNANGTVTSGGAVSPGGTVPANPSCVPGTGDGKPCLPPNCPPGTTPPNGSNCPVTPLPPH
jgi:hypothetical protein